MHQAYKFCIYPNKKQAALINRSIGYKLLWLPQQRREELNLRAWTCPKCNE